MTTLTPAQFAESARAVQAIKGALQPYEVEKTHGFVLPETKAGLMAVLHEQLPLVKEIGETVIAESLAMGSDMDENHRRLPQDLPTWLSPESGDRYSYISAMTMLWFFEEAVKLEGTGQE